MRRVIAVFLLSLSCCTGAIANEVRRFSLKELVDRSDLIAIGVGTGQRDRSETISINEISAVDVNLILKGTSASSVQIITRGEFIELDVDCCDQGTSYLIFVTEARSGMYAPTNGRYSVFEMSGDAVLNWSDECPSKSLEEVREDVLGATERRAIMEAKQP